MDSLQSSVNDSSSSSKEIAVNQSSITTPEEIVVSDEVSAKYVEEIVAYEHGDESEAIKSKLFEFYFDL